MARCAVLKLREWKAFSMQDEEGIEDLEQRAQTKRSIFSMTESTPR